MKTKFHCLFAVLALLAGIYQVDAQGTAFTYQGRLNMNGSAANGNYEFEFVLYPTNQSGFPVGPVSSPNAAVSNGLFIVTLDLGDIFTGTNYWLDVYVRTNGAASFTELSPRQPITPTPYAVFAEKVSSGGLTSGVYSNSVTLNNPANSFSGTFTGNGAGLANVNAVTLGGLGSSNFWQIGGNAGTSGGFIGTTDNQLFDVRVNNARVMRYQLNTDGEGFYTNAPNVIGGSSVNTTVTNGVVGATIAGGGGIEGVIAYPNKVTADFGTVSGGHGNTASGDEATVAGGFQNTATNTATVVGGGFYNIASGLAATVGGGDRNTASGETSTVAGGDVNTASGYWDTVGGGAGNTASGDYSTVSGGSGNTASGAVSTVGGGYFNIASGEGSFAAGTHAHAGQNGSFVWADDNSFNFSSTTANQFRVRATGGTAFITAIDSTGSATAGVHVLSGDTAWSSISDRNAKKNFQPLNGEAVLEKLAAIPVQKWNYKWESDTNTPHIGPMAQDFKGAFYPGRDDKSISTLEFDGVELAAIQGLNQKVDELKTELNLRDAENTELKQRLDALEKIILHQDNHEPSHPSAL